MVAAFASATDATEYRLHPSAWVDFGRIMHAEDTLTNQPSQNPILDYSGRTLESHGAQFTLTADLSERMEGGFGFGAYKATHAIGSQQSNFTAISLYQVFVTEARLTAYAGNKGEEGEKGDAAYSATVGVFPYIYNPDVKNLGLYLLRGMVYPGILMGGFGDFAADSSKGNIFGARFHHAHGPYGGDLILNCEMDVPPTFDWSLAYLGHLNLRPLRLGAGVNFYRALPYDAKLETPGKHPETLNGAPLSNYIEVDRGNSAAPETTFFTFQGIKLDATASLDIQELLGLQGHYARDDWKIYGEAGIIGLRNYGKTYGKLSRRIPVMLGFNFPTWGLLDHLSLEVEYYGARYRNDLALVGNNNLVADWTIQDHPTPSPKPPTDSLYLIQDHAYVNRAGDTVRVAGTALDKDNLTRDDLKWSLYLDKIVAGHIRFIGQIANDHYRPRPVAAGMIKSTGGTAEVFADRTSLGAPDEWYKPWTVLKGDWYYMIRIGFLF